MKLFTVGPVEMSDETMRIGNEPIPYFRTDDFSAIMLQLEKDILSLMDAPPNSRLITLTASGTGAMESCVINLLDKDDKILVIDGGSFGHRFAQLCEIHGLNYQTLKLDFPQALTQDDLDPFDGQGFGALLVNIDETATGQLYDYMMLSDFCKKNDMLFIVDGISSFLVDDLSMVKGDIDALITSSQKAMSLPPGLSFVALTSKTIESRIEGKQCQSMYFDFNSYLKNMERGQTPFTPAVGIILQLQERIDSILSEGGAGASVAQHAERAQHFRSLCRKAAIEYADYPLSNALTPLIFSDGSAMEVFNIMKNRFDKMLTPTGGELAPYVLRVGHLGNLALSDFDELIHDLQEILRK